MTKSRVTQFTILYGVLVLLVIGAYVFFYLHIQSKDTQTAIMFSEVEQIQNQNKQFKDLSAVLRDIQVSQEKLNSYFVQGDSIVEFLEAIEATGDISGAEVTVRSIKEDETNIENISELTLDLTAKGTWESLYHLLVLLETFPVKSTFDHIQLNGPRNAEGGEDDGEWSAVFTMRVLQLAK